MIRDNYQQVFLMAERMVNSTIKINKIETMKNNHKNSINIMKENIKKYNTDQEFKNNIDKQYKVLGVKITPIEDYKKSIELSNKIIKLCDDRIKEIEKDKK